eukprot:1649372-Rhodomonas_salina.3
MPYDESQDQTMTPRGSAGSRPTSVTVFNREGPVLFTGVLVCMGPKCFAVPPNDPSFQEQGLHSTIAELLKDDQKDIIPYEQVRVQVVGDSVLVTLLDATGPRALSSNKLAQDLLLLSLNPTSELYSRGIGKSVGSDRYAGDQWKESEQGQPDESGPPSRVEARVPAAEHGLTLPECRRVVGEAKECPEESMHLTAELGKEVETMQSADFFNAPSIAREPGLDGDNRITAESRLNASNGKSQWVEKQTITERIAINSASIPQSRFSDDDRIAPDLRRNENDRTEERGSNQPTANRDSVMAKLEDALANSRRSLHRTAMNSSLVEGLPASRRDVNNSFLSESSITNTPNSRQTWNPRGSGDDANVGGETPFSGWRVSGTAQVAVAFQTGMGASTHVSQHGILTAVAGSTLQAAHSQPAPGRRKES